MTLKMYKAALGGIALITATLFFSVTEQVWAQSQGQSVRRLTFNVVNDIGPTWDPRGVTIAYIRPKTTSSSMYDAYQVSSSGQGGELPLLNGLAADFGVAVALSWIGTTGFLAVEEAISGFEVLKFNTALAPFDRTTPNGSDSANQLLLSINGGGGGGLTKFSRDGNVALIRFSSSGSAGAVSIRSGLASTMVGQTSSAFGTVLLSASDARFLSGGALNPDGSQLALSVPSGIAGTPQDIIIKPTSVGGPSVNLTNTGRNGFDSVDPEFSPDGKKIVFARADLSAGGTYDLFLMNTDGSGLTQLTSTANFAERSPSWAPDGLSIAFSGTHVAGRESEFPALLPGETANANIYILTLAASATVTPRTKLTEPPATVVTNRKVTFTLAAFAKAQKSIAAARIAAALGDLSEPSSLEATVQSRRAPTYTFQYEVVVNKVGGKRDDPIRKTSTRNVVTFSRVPPGSYSAKYRVNIFKKAGRTLTLAGRTKFSPASKFSVS